MRPGSSSCYSLTGDSVSAHERSEKISWHVSPHLNLQINWLLNPLVYVDSAFKINGKNTTYNESDKKKREREVYGDLLTHSARVECSAKQQPFERVLTTPHVKETAPNSTGHPQTSHCELQLAIMLY